MRSYVAIVESTLECEACTRPAGPGTTGFTEDMIPGRVVPVCATCLRSLDPRLHKLQQLAELARSFAADSVAWRGQTSRGV